MKTGFDASFSALWLSFNNKIGLVSLSNFLRNTASLESSEIAINSSSALDRLAQGVFRATHLIAAPDKMKTKPLYDFLYVMSLPQYLSTNPITSELSIIK